MGVGVVVGVCITLFVGWFIALAIMYKLNEVCCTQEHIKKKLGSKFLRFLVGKHLIDKEHSAATVRLRTAWASLLVLVPLLLILILLLQPKSLLRDFGIDSLEGFGVCLFGYLGVIWAFYTSFQSDFISKFRFLDECFNKCQAGPGFEPEKYGTRKFLTSKYFTSEYLNFCEQGLVLGLHNHDIFRPVFKDCMIVAAYIKSQYENEYKNIKYSWEEVEKYLNESGFFEKIEDEIKPNKEKIEESMKDLEEAYDSWYKIKELRQKVVD